MTYDDIDARFARRFGYAVGTLDGNFVVDCGVPSWVVVEVA